MLSIALTDRGHWSWKQSNYDLLSNGIVKGAGHFWNPHTNFVLTARGSEYVYSGGTGSEAQLVVHITSNPKTVQLHGATAQVFDADFYPVTGNTEMGRRTYPEYYPSGQCAIPSSLLQKIYALKGLFDN